MLCNPFQLIFELRGVELPRSRSTASVPLPGGLGRTPQSAFGCIAPSPFALSSLSAFDRAAPLPPQQHSPPPKTAPWPARSTTRRSSPPVRIRSFLSSKLLLKQPSSSVHDGFGRSGAGAARHRYAAPAMAAGGAARARRPLAAPARRHACWPNHACHNPLIPGCICALTASMPARPIARCPSAPRCGCVSDVPPAGGHHPQERLHGGQGPPLQGDGRLGARLVYDLAAAGPTACMAPYRCPTPYIGHIRRLWTCPPPRPASTVTPSATLCASTSSRARSTRR